MSDTCHNHPSCCRVTRQLLPPTMTSLHLLLVPAILCTASALVLIDPATGRAVDQVMGVATMNSW